MSTTALPGAAALPPGLLAAVLDYEDALRVDDLDRTGATFVDSPDTWRGDADGLLVGSDALRTYRRGRGGVLPRRLVRIVHHVLDHDAVLVTAASRYESGGDGLQTQLWVRDPDRWRIAAAHVTGRPSAFDRTVWRVLGDPLLPGSGSGPLAGLAVAVKDLFAVAGHAIGAGNPTFLAEAATEPVSAPAVRALLDAGADLRGIARTDEFAYSIAGANEHHGTPRNVRVPGALPGGSSSGPATAVALGQADIGLGTDTAGSIRVPASYQGLWGLRTTTGAVDATGLLPLAPTFDTVGWLTRDLPTLRAAAATVLPEGPDLAGGWLVPDDLGEVSPGVRAAFEDLVAPLRPRPVHLPVGSVLLGVFRLVQQSEVWAVHGAWVDAHQGALGPSIAERFALAAAVDTDAVARARDELRVLRATIRDTVGDGVLLLPTTPGPAPARTTTGTELETVRQATLALTAVAGIGSLPAVSAPLLEVTGGPVGLGLVGPAGRDLALLDAAATLVRHVRPTSPDEEP